MILFTVTFVCLHLMQLENAVNGIQIHFVCALGSKCDKTERQV